MDHRLGRWGRPRGAIRKLIELEASTYPAPTAYIASTPSVVEEIEQRYGLELDRERVATIGHGLPDSAAGISPSRRQGAVEVLFVGRLEPRKGIDTLLACLPSLAGEFPDLTFTIVGADNIPSPSGPTYRELFERSEAGARLRDRVRFTGVLSEADLARRYADCDIFVAPSKYESFGLILLEAMMFGKPVIASDVGGMAHIVEPDGNGFLVPPGDAQSLRQAVARLAASSELRARLGRRSRELYEQRYSAPRMVDETIAFYQRLVGRAAPARRKEPAQPTSVNGNSEERIPHDQVVAAAAPPAAPPAGDRSVGLASPEAPGPVTQKLPSLEQSMTCPACGAAARPVAQVITADGRTKTGQLVCDACGRVVATIDHFKYDFLIEEVESLDGTVETRRSPVLGERRVHWSDPAISYSRGWSRSEDAFMKSTGKAGDTFTFAGTFTDAQVRLLRHPHGGIVDVFLDGRHIGAADLYMPIGAQVVAVSAGADLPLGEHQVSVRVRGTANPESQGRQVPFEELLLFGPAESDLGFQPPGPINRGNGYPDVVERYVAQAPPDGWILECGGGDRRRAMPNVVNFEYMKYELADLYGDAHHMPFADGTFSLVYTQAVFEHLRDPFEVARELIRVTRPGGLIVTEVAFLQPLHAAPYHYFNMTHWGVEELFRDCTVVESGWDGSLAFTVDWLMKSVGLAAKIPPSRFAAITKQFEQFDRLISHDELKPAASGVWVVVRKDP
jgi:SAM-dependent methyltransferase